MPGIANRVRKASTARAAPKRGFLPSTVGQTSDYMSGSLAASAGGVMKPEMPSSAFKQRRVEMAEEDKGSVALRTVTYPIFAASTEASYTSEDGSSFVVSTQDAPMHIPGSATNLTASLVNASVPYVWDNLKEDQTVSVDGHFPRRVELAEDKEISYTLFQPSNTVQNTSGTVGEAEEGSPETTDYLQDADEQPFWYRPALEDAFLNMDNARFKNDGTSEWKDLTTATGGSIKSRAEKYVKIVYTGSDVSVGDRVYQDQGSSVIARGHVVRVDSANNYVYARILIGSPDFVDAPTATIYFYDPLDGSEEDSITSGTVVNTSLSSTNLLPESPLLTGEELTGSPMVKFDQKANSNATNSNLVYNSATSGEVVLPDSALDALKSLYSDHTFVNSASAGTPEHNNGVITIPIRFNQATLDKMAEIENQLDTKYGGISDLTGAGTNTTYIKDVSRTVIRLCSFDISVPGPNDGTLERSLSVFLACEPRSSTAPGWRLGIEVQEKENQQLVFRQYKHGGGRYSFSATEFRTGLSGEMGFGGLGVIMHNVSSVELGSSSSASQASLQDLCFLQLIGQLSERTTEIRAQTSLRVRLTDTRSFSQSDIGTNGGAGLKYLSFCSLSHSFGSGKDNTNFWKFHDVRNFRIGSQHHTFVDGTNLNGSGLFDTISPVAYQGGNFHPGIAYRTGGGTIWGDTPGLGFLVGDIFAVDNARLGRAGVSNMGELTSHKTIMDEILQRYEDPLKQQFDPANASPFVALPSQDATTASDYTSIVRHDRSFKLPPGNYGSVEAYIEAVNAALSEDTTSRCGLADLISLDIDHDSMDVENDGDRNYKLEVHYNRPISGDNPLLTASTVGSGVEPLLNQRVNINMSNLGPAFPVYTKVREAGDYVLLFADADNGGYNDLDILLIHKPSLSVTPISPPPPSTFGGSAAFNRIADMTIVTHVSPRSELLIVALEVTDIKFRYHFSQVEDPTNWTTTTTFFDHTNGNANTANKIVGKLVGINGDGTDAAQNATRVLAFVSGIGGSNVHNHAQILRIRILQDGSLTTEGAPTGLQIGGYDGNNPTTNWAIVDAEQMDANGVYNDDFQALITMRNVYSNSSDNYRFRGVHWSDSGNTKGLITIDGNLDSAIGGGDLDEARVGVDSNGAITDYAKAARMPKITLSNKAYFSDGNDTLVGVNVPDHSGSGTVAILVGRTGNAADSTFQLWKGLANSVVTHDIGDGNCVKVLFSQSPASEDQINLVMSYGDVHVYKYSASQGVIEGTTPTKPEVGVKELWYKFANDPGTDAVDGVTDAVSSHVHNADETKTEQHMFTVGEFTSYEDGDTSQALAAPNFLQRTSMNKAGNVDAIRYFEDKQLPTKIIFNPQDVMDAVWTDSEDDYFVNTAPYDDFIQDLINNADHNSKKYDMFDPNTADGQNADGRLDPLVSYYLNQSITIPKGNYTFASLGRAINELLHELDDTKFGIATIVFEDNESLRKLYASARLSTSFMDDLPNQIKLSWASGPFASLFTESQILLQASGPEPRVYTEDVSYTATGLSAVRTVYLRCNFVQGGMNPQRQKSQILASIPVDKEPGQTLVALPAVPLKVAAQNFLNQGDASTDLEFRLTDEAGNALAIGTAHPWSVNVLIEWEQDINLARLRQSDSETRYR